SSPRPTSATIRITATSEPGASGPAAPRALPGPVGTVGPLQAQNRVIVGAFMFRPISRHLLDVDRDAFRGEFAAPLHLPEAALMRGFEPDNLPAIQPDDGRAAFAIADERLGEEQRVAAFREGAGDFVRQVGGDDIFIAKRGQRNSLRGRYGRQCLVLHL